MNTDRIASLSWKLHWVTAATLFILPVALFCQLMLIGLDKELIASDFGDVVIADNVSDLSGWSSVALERLIVVAVIYTLEQMRRLFAQFAKRQIFDITTSDLILRVGAGLLAIVVIAIIIHPLQAIILTSGNPVGQRAISVEIDDSDIGFLLSSGLLMVIGWAMRDAVALADENREFI